MDNETFSIDDILSEVKKRREENELKIKGEAPKPEPEEVTAEPEVEPEKESEPEFHLNTDEVEKEEAELKINEDEKIILTEEAPVSISQPEPEEEPEQSGVIPDTNGMVDLLALANESEKILQSKPQEDKKPPKKRMNKTVKTIIIVLVLLIIGAGVFAGFYINNMLNKVTDNEEAQDYEMVTYYEGMDFLQEDFPVIEEMSAYELQGYRDYLKKWYENGDPVSSTHVLNVLLIGEDTRDAKITDASRADSAIIASINVDTGKIHLTSVLRDLYVYFEVNGEGHYGKINESASIGGIECYIKTLERYYKIAINNYAVVNFASFPKIVDALGGVTINITSREIYEINNHPKRYNQVTITQDFEGEEGKMKLDGKQALAYCRIRKIDSDGMRANRQKTVLTAIMKKTKKAGKIDTAKVVGQLAGYVYTGYSKKELIAIGNTALKDGWLDYEIVSTNVPKVENCKGGQKFSAAPGNWIWLADIPKDAYELQNEIYGKSNINLNENRADYIALGR